MNTHARSATVLGAVAVVAILLPPTVLAAPTRPAFLSSPSNSAAGVAFATQPAVVIQKNGIVDASATGSIALSIASGPSGASLACDSLSVTLSSGRASFSNCRITGQTGTYTLRGTWSQGGSATSSSFQITGVATKLAFTSQPGGGAVGAAWPNQPVVTVEDASGQKVASTATVTLAIGTNPGGGVLTCSGDLSKAAVGGVATFSGCSIDKAGVGYTLVASSAGLTSATSAPFTIGGGKLVFTTQPARGTPAGAFAVQPIVTVQTAAGTTDTTNTSTITLALATNPGSGTLTCSGGLSKAAVAGVATFSGCAISTLGIGYSLKATATGLTDGTSALFDVADRLAFTAQPSVATVNVAFPIQPAVTVRSGATNTATHDQGTVVTLAIRNGTGAPGAHLTCTGGLTKTAVNGVATFAGCSIDKSGTGYVLTATATGLTLATSTAFNVTAGAELTVTPSASAINYGGGVNVTASFSTSGAGRTITIQSSPNGSTWSNLVMLVTNSFGSATFSDMPTRNRWYRATFAGAADLAAITSPPARVLVRHSVTLKPYAGVIRVLAPRTRVTYSATVRPLAVIGVPRVSFLIYQRVAGVWVFRTSATMSTNAAGVATFSWTWGRGEWYMRARANATPWNAARLSTIARVIVR